MKPFFTLGVVSIHQQINLKKNILLSKIVFTLHHSRESTKKILGNIIKLTNQTCLLLSDDDDYDTHAD